MMDIDQISLAVYYMLLSAAGALLIFFTYVSIRMIISLSRQREIRRRPEMACRRGALCRLHRRFKQDMGKNR